MVPGNSGTDYYFPLLIGAYYGRIAVRKIVIRP